MAFVFKPCELDAKWVGGTLQFWIGKSDVVAAVVGAFAPAPFADVPFGGAAPVGGDGEPMVGIALADPSVDVGEVEWVAVLHEVLEQFAADEVIRIVTVIRHTPGVLLHLIFKV